MLDTKALPKMPAAPGIPRSLLANLIVFAASIGLLAAQASGRSTLGWQSCRRW